MKAKVFVTLKNGVLDPQGKAILVKASEEVGLDQKAYFLPANGEDYAAYRRFYQILPAALR